MSASPTPWTRGGRRGSELIDRGTLASPAVPLSIFELKPTRVDKKIGRVRFLLYSSRYPESASARTATSCSANYLLPHSWAPGTYRLHPPPLIRNPSFHEGLSGDGSVRSAWSVTCTERPSGLSSEHVGSWFSEPVWLTGSVGVSTLPHRTVSAVAVSAVALRTGIGTFSRRDCDS
jgi:hypothetical protein